MGVAVTGAGQDLGKQLRLGAANGFLPIVLLIVLLL